MVTALIKYGLVGVTNTAIDFGTYALLTRSVVFWERHYLSANAIAWFLSTAWGFYWNKRWTFRNQEKKYFRQWVKFITIAFIALALSQGALFIGVHFFGLHDLIAKLSSIVIGALWSFTMHRYWTFKTHG